MTRISVVVVIVAASLAGVAAQREDSPTVAQLREAVSR
jgi:hypothetical protein